MCLKVYPYILLFPAIVRCIDPSESVGLCKNIKFNPTPLYINANEGVWFPQYRSKHPDQNSSEFSCHTIYENVVPPDDEGDAPTLQSEAYYTKQGVPIKNPYITEFQETDVRGILIAQGNSDDSDYEVYSYILSLTPEYRVRYLCTTYTLADPGVTILYIETRLTFPPVTMIKEAIKDIKQYQFGVGMVKVRQRNCRRPLFQNGYGYKWDKSD